MRQRPLVLILTLAHLWLYLLTYSGLHHSVDELSALSVVESWMTTGEFGVNQMEWDQARTPPQNEPGLDGQLYSKKGLGVSLLALPFWWLGRALGLGTAQMVFVSGAFVAALTVACFGKLTVALGYSRGVTAVGMVALGSGALVWPYARTFFSETPSMLGLALALYGAIAFRRAARSGVGAGALVACGVGLALITLSKSSNAVIAPFFALYLAWVMLVERRPLRLSQLGQQLVAVGAPLALAVGGTLAYNHVRFGTLFGFPLRDFETFSTPLLIGLLGLLVSPGKGLLWYAPLGWLALLAVVDWRRNGRLPDHLLAAASVVAPIVLYALWYDWPGGRAWGPRMIAWVVVALAMLALPGLAWLADGSRSRRWRWLAGALLAWSFLVQIPGALVNFERQEALEMKTLPSFDLLLWNWRHSPLFTYWPAIASPNRDALLLQSATWQQHWALALGIVLLAGAALALLWQAWRSPRRAQLSAWSGLPLALLGALLVVKLGQTDPRWHERSADPADNAALAEFVTANAAPSDLLLLDLLASNDSDGRVWWRANVLSAPPEAIGWLRKPTMTAADGARLRAWLALHPVVWLALQNTNEGAADSSTERWLDDWAYRGRQSWIGSQRVVEYLLAGSAEPLAKQGPLLFGQDGQLTAVVVFPGLRAGQFLVDLSWGKLPGDDLRFSVQALSADGQVVAQIDRAPGAADRVGLAAPADAQRLILKLYRAADGAVLPVRVNNGAQEFAVLWEFQAPIVK